MSEKTKLPLECKGCGHRWTEEIELPMEASAAISRMKGWNVCPKCGSKKVYITTARPVI